MNDAIRELYRANVTILHFSDDNWLKYSKMFGSNFTTVNDNRKNLYN